jgi:hypothetical protein
MMLFLTSFHCLGCLFSRPAPQHPPPFFTTMQNALGAGSHASRRRRRLNAMNHHEAVDMEKGEGWGAVDGVYPDPSCAVHHGFRMPEVPIPDYGREGEGGAYNLFVSALRSNSRRQVNGLYPYICASRRLVAGIFSSFQVSKGRKWAMMPRLPVGPDALQCHSCDRRLTHSCYSSPCRTCDRRPRTVSCHCSS